MEAMKVNVPQDSGKDTAEKAGVLSERLFQELSSKMTKKEKSDVVTTVTSDERVSAVNTHKGF